MEVVVANVWKIVVVVALLEPGCIVVTTDGDGARFGPDGRCPRECVNPFSASCWHDDDGCAHLDSDVDSDGDDLADDDEAALGTDPQIADTDGDGQRDGVEVACGADPLDAASMCP